MGYYIKYVLLSCSVLSLENGLSKLDGHSHVTVDTVERGGWVDGLLGCLRPVWSLIDKATSNAEIKAAAQQGTHCHMFYESGI